MKKILTFGVLSCGFLLLSSTMNSCKKDDIKAKNSNGQNNNNNNNNQGGNSIELGTIMAKVNGTQVVIKNDPGNFNYATATLESPDDYPSLDIDGELGTNATALSASILLFPEDTGIFFITGSNNGSASGYGFYGHANDNYDTNTGDETDTLGEIHITEYSRSGNVKGTFHFKAINKNNAQDTLNVTDGAFYLEVAVDSL